MTSERQKCPTSDLTGDRHMVTDRRWELTTPEGETITVCSAACVLWWICAALPSDIEPAHSGTPTGSEAAA